jgi:hypothetical protein
MCRRAGLARMLFLTSVLPSSTEKGEAGDDREDVDIADG